jgi:hypothetical protein
MNNEPTSVLTVDGIVAMRDKQPYVRLLADGKPVAQLSMAEARKVAADIVQMAARTEADAMIHAFFEREGLPPQAGAALMFEFRNFRRALDEEAVEGTLSDPDTGKKV